ncbi:MAG: HAD family phosphatase [Planctomyces sp.]|nr:HAD family phosphatase [Planctomyces sp.]
MAIRTCFFDMGNVLVYFSHDRMCSNIAQLSGLEIADVRRFLMEDGRQWAMERGELSEADFFAQLKSVSDKSFTLPELQNAAANIFWLNESIIPILEELKSQSIRMVLLSNTSITHLRYIEQNFRILEFMDDRIASFEVGAMKPSPVIFEAALNKAGCEPSECFYTDDIAAYIDQARMMGIQSAIFTTSNDLRQALVTAGALPHNAH